MPFVQSAGSLVALDQRPPYPNHPVFSLRLSDWLSQDYATIFRSQPAVRSIVGFVARNIAQLGIGVYRRNSDDDRERLRDHRAAALLRKPNPADRRMTTYRWVHSIMQDLCVHDWALQVKVTSEDQWGLVRILPTRFTPIGNGYWPDRFEIRSAEGKKKIVPAEECVFFQGSIGLDDSLMSIPPIESLRQILAEEYEATRQRQDFWRNGARTSAVIQHPKTLSEGAIKRLSTSFAEKYTRGGTNPGGVPVLEEGMTLHTGGTMTSRDAQYIESRKLTREEAAAAWHVPPAMAGITAQAPFASIREQHQMLYQDTLGPWLQMFQQDLNAQLLPDFADSEDVYVEFNVEEKLRGAFETQAQSLQMSVGAPWMTRNEARKIRNLPPVEGGDELVTPLNVIIGGQASPRDSDPTLNSQARRVLGRHLQKWEAELARNGELDEERCVDDLEAALPETAKRFARALVSRVSLHPDPQIGIQEMVAELAAVAS